MFGSIGNLGGFIGGGAAVANRYEAQNQSLAQQQRLAGHGFLPWGCTTPVVATPKKCRVGKITAKPGYVIDYGNPDLVRKLTKQDYTWPQRFVLWWNNYEWED